MVPSSIGSSFIIGQYHVLLASCSYCEGQSNESGSTSCEELEVIRKIIDTAIVTAVRDSFIIGLHHAPPGSRSY